MTPLDGQTAGQIHNRLQRARSQAEGIEDPSVRRAIDELAAALAELTKALRDD